MSRQMGIVGLVCLSIYLWAYDKPVGSDGCGGALCNTNWHEDHVTVQDTRPTSDYRDSAHSDRLRKIKRSAFLENILVFKTHYGRWHRASDSALSYSSYSMQVLERMMVLEKPKGHVPGSKGVT